MATRRTLLAAAAATPAAVILPRAARRPDTWPTNPWPLRIDTWGDSITYGEAGDDRSKTGYRKYLKVRLDAAGVAHEPIQDYSWPGWGLDNLRANAVARILAFEPDLAIINIGSNDAGSAALTATFGDRYRGLLADIIAAKPDLRIVASMLQYSSGPYGYLASNEYQINQAIAAVCPSFPAVIGIMQCHLIPTCQPISLPDGLHPTDFGWQLYADQAFNRMAPPLHFGLL